MSTVEFNDQVAGMRGGLEYFAIHLCMNREDARDLLQDTILKALRYRDRFKDRTNLKAWMYTIMKNTFINNYRKAQRSKTVLEPSEDLYQLTNAAGSRENSPEVVYTTGEIQQKVDSLTDTLRIPFQMHFQGFKYKEIAEKLELPIGTVKSRIFLARQQLMEALKAYSN
ncbi:MAG: sigma-70 family RNA polymerase sigma factor [Bacteroidota bacterium]